MEPELTTSGAPLCGLPGATLTPGHIAIEPAGNAAARLDAYLDAMKRSGVLRTTFTILRVSVHRDSKRF
jgi:hypothetical protein